MQNESSPLLVFEDPADARVHRFLAGTSARVRSCEAWFAEAFPSTLPVLADLPERKQLFFEALIPDAPHAAFTRGTLRQTLEELRAADVVTEDDVALAFATLPATPAYQSLALAAEAMASNFAGSDVPSLARSLPLVGTFSEPPRFVATGGGSSVFRSLAAATGGTVVETVSVSDRPLRRQVLRIDGPSSGALLKIVETVRRRLERGRKVLVMVAGTAAETLWLESALAGVAPLRSLAERPLPSSSAATPWAIVRQCRELPTADRLHWARRLDRLSRGNATEAVQTLLQEMRRDGVSEPIVQLLTQRFEFAPRGLISQDDDPEAPLAIASLRPVASFSGADVVAVVGDGSTEAGRPSLLTPSDRARLAAQGFLTAQVCGPSTALEALGRPAGRRRQIFILGTDGTLPTARGRVAARERETRDPRWNIDGLEERSSRASATQLATFAECPAKYVARYRWRWAPPEAAENEFHRWVGTLAHALLEHWHRQQPKVPTPGGAGELQELFPTARASAFREGDGPPPALEVAVRRRALALAARALAIEPALADRFGVRSTLGVELGFEWRADGVSFGGRYDRVVELANGAKLVLDYKTGATRFSPAHATNGEDPQGALYWLSGNERFGDQFAGVLFVSLKESSAERGVLRRSLVGAPPTVRGHVLDEERWSQGLASARSAITERARQLFVERRFAPTPKPETCERCGYGPLCRGRWGDV